MSAFVGLSHVALSSLRFTAPVLSSSRPCLRLRAPRFPASSSGDPGSDSSQATDIPHTSSHAASEAADSEAGAADSESHVADVSSDADVTVPVSVPTPARVELTAERKAELAAARLEAQRLDLMASEAALNSERARLVAARKRLELQTLKAKRGDFGDAPEDQPKLTSAGDAPAAAPKAAPSDKDTGVDAVKPPPFLQRNTPFTQPMLEELLGDFPRVSKEDIATLREKVMSINTFYVTDVERSPFDERIVFRGNLRVPAAQALAELEEASIREGLGERIRLFILTDPKQAGAVAGTKDSEGDEDEDEETRPVVVALPAAAVPNQTTTPAAVLSVVAAFATIFTALSYGVGIFGVRRASPLIW
jgi:hypothetical protein